MKGRGHACGVTLAALRGSAQTNDRQLREGRPASSWRGPFVFRPPQ